MRLKQQSKKNINNFSQSVQKTLQMKRKRIAIAKWYVLTRKQKKQRHLQSFLRHMRT